MPRAIQGLYKLWETQRINTTVMPEMPPPYAVHKNKSYRNLQLISSMLHPDYCLKTALYRFYLHGGQWGFRSATSPNVRIRPFRVSPGCNYYFMKVCYTHWGAVNTLSVPLYRYRPYLADIWRSREITQFLQAHTMIKQEKKSQVKSQPHLHCCLHDL